MASNFWTSSQCFRLSRGAEASVTPCRLDRERHGLSDDDVSALFSHFVQLMQQAGEGLGLRQHVIASSIVYFQRLYRHVRAARDASLP